MRLVALVLVVATCAEAEVLSLADAKSELYVYRKRVEFLREALVKSCPQYAAAEPGLDRREASSDLFLHKTSIEVEKETFNHLLKLLTSCRLAASKSSLTTRRIVRPTTKATTKRTIRPTTVKKVKLTTTKPVVRYNPCTSPKTLNLTEEWRNSYKQIFPKDERHDDTKLLKKDIWFRFQGAAGRQLKNTCPLWYSCGAGSGYWSDDQMPTRIGETRQFNMYESWSKNARSSECKLGDRKFSAMVTRCSGREGDFVYKFNTNMSGGADTVCGMN